MRTYYAVETLIGMISEPARSICLRVLRENEARFRSEPGSSHNHQAWRGGYLDHVAEVLNIAVVLYEALSSARPLPFTLSDALLVLFFHDIEKPWRFHQDPRGAIWQRAGMQGKSEKAEFRDMKLQNYGVVLTAEQRNAFIYVEGEGEDYSSEQRTMNELGAFCHLCDTASARIWHAHPLAQGDPWAGAARHG